MENVIVAGVSTVFVLQDNGMYRARCGRCNGSGVFSWATSMGAMSGVCFKCNGSPFGREHSHAEVVAIADRRAKAQAKRDAKAKAEWEAGQAERDAQAKRDAERAEARQAERVAFEWIEGEVGDKVSVSGEVISAKVIESQFGSSMLIVIKVDASHEVKMFTSASWAWEVERGDVWNVSGAIKSHDEYEGKKQTQLVRVKGVK